MNDRAAFRAAAALAVGLTLVAVLVLLLLEPGRVSAPLRGEQRPAAASLANDGAGTGAAAPALGPEPVPAAPPPPVDPLRPFDGSPAAGWPSGVAGIAMPAATRAGAFRATEAAASLGLARQYVAELRLDPEVLAGGHPHRVLALLDPKSTEPATLEAALRRPTADTSYQVTRFDPAGTRLHGSVVKVKGGATFAAAAPNELVVSLDYTIVYAVRRAGSVPAEVTRVVLREQLQLSTWHGMDTTPGKVWVKRRATQVAGVACDAADGYLHPSYDSELRRDPRRTGEVTDPYDDSRPITGEPGCGTAARV